jgi:hypothetical protein
MPQTGETDGQGDKAVAHLHYFMGQFDFWITERDIGDGTADRTRLIVEGSFERSRGIEHEWH